MKAKVDQSLCIGCGLCVTTCPDVFRMNDDGVAEAFQEYSTDLVDSVNEAIDGCPVGAISTEA
ncbi:ferredoxin [Flexilinea flocculi]|jgi:ferredoxin|uniref:Ferredoxin n=1 Tax=Flexilinea flocculi TaxID=1678840 RepID=A0A0S7BW95_9CHLR|nr:ferredoxin [Flexilinea flocculi]NMB94508.1 ferredoxin [Flexilinea flocculi]GAP41270.1 ferredoxin [Flexilinea flocculi]